MGEELEFGALSRQARTVTTSHRKNGSYENIKDEPMDVACANDDENDKLEVMFAEKIILLESFQTFLTDTLEVKRKLTIFRNDEQNDNGQTEETTVKGLKSKYMMAVADRFGESTRSSDPDTGKNVLEDIDTVIDSVIEEVCTKSLQISFFSMSVHTPLSVGVSKYLNAAEWFEN